MPGHLTAIIEREGDGYVSLCPEVDIASQGRTVDEARSNLKEALDLFFEGVSVTEIERRLHNEVYVTQVEVAVGQDAGSPGPRRLPSARRPRLRPGEAAGGHVPMQRSAAGSTVTIPVPERWELCAGTLMSIIRQPGFPRALFE